MKYFYLALSLLAFCTFTVSHAQCTPVATFSEDFETFTTFPDKCWASNHPPGLYIDIHSSANEIFLNSSHNNLQDVYVISPEVSTIDGQHFLTFDITNINTPAITNSTVEVGTMSDNTDISTFSAVGTAFAPTVGTHTFNSFPANPSHKYVVIRFIPTQHNQVIRVDNIKWETSASTKKFDAGKVNIYPNPSTGVFFIDTEIDVKSIEVYNTLGQRISQSNQKKINLENAASGMYIVNVYAADGTQASYKIVKN